MELFDQCFENPKTLKREKNEIIKERAARTKEVAREEARNLTTTSDEKINFFER